MREVRIYPSNLTRTYKEGGGGKRKGGVKIAWGGGAVVKITLRKKRRHAAGVSPFLAWGDFHARSRFARSTIPEEKWGTIIIYS